MGDIPTLDATHRPGLLSRLARAAVVGLFRLTGWRAAGTLPPGGKYVLAGASHTSNWDFVVFLGTVDAMGIRPHYMGKKSLFRWPVRRFMLDMGGIPVDRGKRADRVRQIAAEFARHEEFALVIAIEGTRSATRDWKSGFYRIALEAGVPIVCVGPDYEHKLGIIGPTIHPTGDFEKDMAPGFAFFKSLMPAHPEKTIFPDGEGVGKTRIDPGQYPIASPRP
ncbi:lysophospholipid acyltransferase family protein [Sphingomicrobium lutaoense]|uniref:1-acyl-sn-glycerol-3-phosphate acyltransferase n=1 Tax=Sphingomicrobium lutaoense TaxID=515949 RepID=A0A839YX01_9SPHN|nr:lysophospholipid acyltransferase family protein [Sphingomicrobium lutaoense]MBB3764731.1 1-acyl-sn-glycerol-3-phosphate acyltransferase [Sphingomicrobium lutaoense]